MPNEKKDPAEWKAVTALRVEKNQALNEGVFVTDKLGQPMFIRGSSIDALYVEPPVEYDELAEPEYTVLINGTFLLIPKESYDWLLKHLEKFSFLASDDYGQA